MTPLVLVLTIVFVALAAPIALLATVYLTRIYRRTRSRGWAFRMMVNASWLKTICGSYVGYQAIRGIGLTTGLWELPAFQAPWNNVVLLIAAIVLVAPPTYYAARVYLVRRDVAAAVARGAYPASPVPCPRYCMVGIDDDDVLGPVANSALEGER